jgi:hypothetical protein
MGRRVLRILVSSEQRDVDAVADAVNGAQVDFLDARGARMLDTNAYQDAEHDDDRELLPGRLTEREGG